MLIAEYLFLMFSYLLTLVSLFWIIKPAYHTWGVVGLVVVFITDIIVLFSNVNLVVKISTLAVTLFLVIDFAVLLNPYVKKKI